MAFGEHDGTGVTGGPMTAQQARQMAKTHSSPVWDEVAAELIALETAQQQTPPPPPVQDELDDAALAPCGAAKPTLSINNPEAGRHDTTVDFQISLSCIRSGVGAGAHGLRTTVDFQISLSCIPSTGPVILLTPVRDGDIGENMFVPLTRQQTTATVTIAIGTENQLALALAWNTGLANNRAQGNVTYTD